MSDEQIQEVDGRFVISSGGTWLPGSYESFEAAEYAFGFDVDLLQRFQEAANKTPNPEERVIRLASMKGFAGLRKGGNWVRIAPPLVDRGPTRIWRVKYHPTEIM